MDDRVVLLIVTTVCAVGAITLIAVRRLARSSAPGSTVPVPARMPSPHAVARTYFVDGGGYVDIGGVVAWASADPALRILPGHVLQYEPAGDGHTVTVVGAELPPPEEHRA